VAGGALLFQGIENLMGHNAGSFGGMGGMGSTGGFLGQNQPTEITNNYYGSQPRSTDTSQDGFGLTDSGAPLVADNDETLSDFDQGQDQEMDMNMDFSGGGNDS
jgi:hypothetical protein